MKFRKQVAKAKILGVRGGPVKARSLKTDACSRASPPGDPQAMPAE
jgi:hypothetical protein